MHSGTIRNAAATRSYAFTYTQNVADASQYNVVTIPGCTDGVWAIDNTAGLSLVFAMACGTTYTAPSANSWLTTTTPGYFAAPGQVNGVAATTDAFRLTGVVVLPGLEAPSAARSALIMRPYDQELLTCKRYWQQYPLMFIQNGVAATTTVYPVAMRNTPTITGGGAGFGASNPSATLVTLFQTTAAYQTIVLDARL